MAIIHRRSFLERLGLGAGALLLGPSITSFVREARGAVPARKRLVMVVQGNGMNYVDFTPPEHKAHVMFGAPSGNQVVQADFAQFSDMFRGMHKAMAKAPQTAGHAAGLDPHRKDILLVDGLANHVNLDDHSAWYGAVTCLPNNPMIGPNRQPTGPSFDQYYAQSPAGGNGAVFKSIALGIHAGSRKEVGGWPPDSSLRNLVFAEGANKPVPVTLLPTAAYKTYISGVVKDPAMMAGPPPFARRKKLLDFVRDDVKRTQAALGSAEKAKMDQVLASFETLDKQMADLAMRASSTKINLGPIVADPETEDRIKLHMQIWTTAVIANLTNVVSFSGGATCAGSGINWDGLGFVTDSHKHGHNEWASDPLITGNPGLNPLNEVHKFYAGHLADAIAALKAVPEGNGTMFDNTIIVWNSDGGDMHHANFNRWPMVIATGAKNGFWKPFGRYVRYPIWHPGDARSSPTVAQVDASRPTGGRCLAEMYWTIARALGAPTTTFGVGGTEKPTDILHELVV